MFFIPVILAFIIFFAVTFFLSKKSGKGTLQVTSVPPAAIYLNGKMIGKSPFPKTETPPWFDTGDYTIRLVPDDTNLQPFEEKISIVKSVLTVVDRTFGQGAFSEGSVISLVPLDTESDAEIQILSFPDKANIKLDDNDVGFTPLLLKSITESDHEIKISRDGYKDKAIHIRTKTGYTLTAAVYLAVSADLSATPTPASVAATITSSPASPQVVILQTPTGFLNVRSSASLNGAIIGKVNPGDIVFLIEEVSGWDHITLPDGKNGWISASYAKKQ